MLHAVRIATLFVAGLGLAACELGPAGESSEPEPAEASLAQAAARESRGTAEPAMEEARRATDEAEEAGREAAEEAAEGAGPAEGEVGGPAPSFEARDDSGELWRSEDHIGDGILVLYFYPADMTGGCTTQACSFRDAMDELRAADIEVVGVSGDAVKNHQLFKELHGLDFTLLSDEDGSIAEKFGVPVGEGGSITRTVNGEDVELTRGVTIQRWTVVIDESGRIVHKRAVTDPGKDPQVVREVVEELDAARG